MRCIPSISPITYMSGLQILVPQVGIGPTTCALSRRCSTIELLRQIVVRVGRIELPRPRSEGGMIPFHYTLYLKILVRSEGIEPSSSGSRPVSLPLI